MFWSLKAKISATASVHSHDIAELVLCYGDVGYLRTSENNIDFKVGRTLLIPPGAQHQMVVVNKIQAEIKIFCMSVTDMQHFLSPAQMTSVQQLFSMGVSIADAAQPSSNLLSLGDQVSEGINQATSATQQLNWSLISLILALHSSRYRLETSQLHITNRQNKYQQKIQQVASWIENHLQESIGLDQAAAKFGLSRSLFSREFHRYTGMSFVEHCNTRRVEKAARVLSSTELNITEVAFGSGFSNLSHFHRQFKANYGLTPGAFRRKMMEEGGR
jgi:AraC family transcriptional activator of mar-sox-rob regulon